MPGERLVAMMKEAGRNGIPKTTLTDLVWGDVVSIAPLKVQVKNEPKLLLTEAFLILSPLCIAKTFTIPAWNANNESVHTHQYQDDNGTSTVTKTSAAGSDHGHTISQHTVTVWRGLEVGDTVVMLRVSGGNKFYVLQREGAL